jgi:hypothetical protein
MTPNEYSEIAGNRATVEKYKAYEKYLLLSNQKGEVCIY